MGERFQHAVDAMDANSWDDDGRQRLSSYARGESAFLFSLYEGGAGRFPTLVGAVLFAAVLVWVFT